MKLRIVLLVLVLSTEGIQRPKEKYLQDNQVMFREKGIVINKAIFAHVKFTMEMGPIVESMFEIGKKLKEVYETEKENSNLDILPYLMGSEGNSSIWRQNEAAELWRKRAVDGAAISGMLYSMFNGSMHELVEALTVIPESYDTHIGHRFHERHKRFIFGAPALAMSTSNWIRIDRLEKSFANFTSKYNKLIDNVMIMNEKHIQLATDVAMLKTLMKLLNHKNYHKIITQVMALEEKLRNTISDVKAMVREGQRGKIAEEMLGGSELIKFFDMMVEKAKDFGCRLVMEHPTDVYELDATFGYNGKNKTFVVYLHVPMYEIGEELKLWEYVPFPIIQSLTLNSTIVPKTGKENFIALMPDDSVKTNTVSVPHRFRIFNEYDLNMCKRLRNIYMCGGRNTLRTDIENSCIGNLYLRDHHGITRTCDLEIGRLEEFVAKIGVNKWVVFSPKPLRKEVKCGKEKDIVMFEIQTLIELPEDCMIRLESTVLTTDININIEYSLQHFSFKYDGNIFDELNIDDKKFAVYIQEMIATKSKFGIKDLTHLKHYYEYTESGLTKLWNYLENTFGFLFMLDDIIMVAVIIMVGVIIFIVLSRMGFMVKCCRMVRGGNQLINATMDDQLREVIVRGRRNSLINLNQMQNPPPYNALNFAPSCPTERPSMGEIRRTDSTLSIDSRYEPSQLREDGQGPTDPRECNPGPVADRGRRRDSFVCTQHSSDRGSNCTGYFTPRPRPRNVRFQVDGDTEAI